MKCSWNRRSAISSHAVVSLPPTTRAWHTLAIYNNAWSLVHNMSSTTDGMSELLGRSIEIMSKGLQVYCWNFFFSSPNLIQFNPRTPENQPTRNCTTSNRTATTRRPIKIVNNSVSRCSVLLRFCMLQTLITWHSAVLQTCKVELWNSSLCSCAVQNWPKTAQNGWRDVGRPQIAMHRKCHII